MFDPDCHFLQHLPNFSFGIDFVLNCIEFESTLGSIWEPMWASKTINN